jgi:hypothetical protein
MLFLITKVKSAKKGQFRLFRPILKVPYPFLSFLSVKLCSVEFRKKINGKRFVRLLINGNEKFRVR